MKLLFIIPPHRKCDAILPCKIFDILFHSQRPTVGVFAPHFREMGVKHKTVV